jgi:ATP-dependent Lon protease
MTDNEHTNHSADKAPDQAASIQDKQARIPDRLPVMPLRDAVVFPFMALPLTISSKRFIKIIDDVMETEQSMFAISMIHAPKRDEEWSPGPDDVHHTGSVVTVVKMMRMPDDSVQCIVHGVSRCKLSDFTQPDPYMTAAVTPLEEDEPDANDQELQALAHNLRENFGKFSEASGSVPAEFVMMVLNINDLNRLADVLSTVGNITPDDRQRVLETVDLRERLNLVNRLLLKTLEVVEIGKKIQSKVKDSMDKTQREYVLREQMKQIQEELGERDEKSVEVEDFRKKIEAAQMPEEANKAALRELDRLMRMPPSAAEYNVIRTYLEWLTELPWSKSTDDNLDLKNAQKVLDTDHYGLEKVKDRILEFLAVRRLKENMKSPILCFVGPPGVGKTSMGRSIANAMGRQFTRMSLGGVRDEAEIRGHRRTYVGALPGRLIHSLRRAGANNPVIMMDEVDKIGNDFRGDPASALLEVLDPEQNIDFLDHYLDVPFDLSRTLFIVTANVLHTIPDALRDRLEVIEIPGYIEKEKMEIAKRYLIPRQTDANGLPAKHISFQDAALRHIISQYTAEAGVRNLEREIGRVCRKVARDYSMGKKQKVAVTPAKVEKYLGKPRRQPSKAERLSVPGVAIGMAWTPVGGDILFIEANAMPGAKRLTLTGKLGDVMKESAQIALTCVRANAKKLGVPEDFHEKNDIHIHVPAGAIPKDGPSAGVTLFTALVSLLTGRRVRSDMSMTGEISLRGQVLPVGGIKEKVLAAHRAGVKVILLPEKNKVDYEEVPAEVRKQLKAHFLKNLDQLVKLAFEEEQGKKGAGKVREIIKKHGGAGGKKQPVKQQVAKDK